MDFISVGSKNPVKVSAVQKALASYDFGNNIPLVHPCAVQSAVSKQPLCDRECLQGAFHRAFEAARLSKEEIGHDPIFSIGLEGGVHKTSNQWYERAWIVIARPNGNVSTASTISIEIPDSLIAPVVEGGREIGDLCDERLGIQQSKEQNGLFGILTANRITREIAYRDAVIAAFAKFFVNHGL